MSTSPGCIYKTQDVLNLGDCKEQNISKLLNKFKLDLCVVNNNKKIPGSYWGDSEAGLIDNKVYARSNTPIHSILHETCHYICMDNARRIQLHTNAEGDYDEENAVCYLQILLASDIPEMGSKRMMQDMNSWGYTFRMGSAQAWFENDSEDTLAWLHQYQLIDHNNLPSYILRH